MNRNISSGVTTITFFVEPNKTTFVLVADLKAFNVEPNFLNSDTLLSWIYFKSIINGLIIGSICNIVFTLMMSEYYLYESIIGIIILLIILLYRKKA